MDAKQLRENIVRPALLVTDMWSQAAENLVMGTAAQESHLQYVHQLGDGPALSLFQMEPNTYDDICLNYLAFRSDLTNTILEAIEAESLPEAARLEWDLRLSTIMCRVHYRRVAEALPNEHDIHALAQYWKTHYNTEFGAGEVHEFVDNYSLVGS